MTMVRWAMLEELKKAAPDVEIRITYGVTTKRKRQKLKLPKSHVNDAYAMGEFHPVKRADTQYWRKTRRHDRILQRFYDAVYLDTRDGKEKKGNELSCGRINRNHKKDSENLRRYRGHKISSGYFSVRRDGNKLQPGSIVLYNGEWMTVHGTHTSYRQNKKGERIKSVNVEFTQPASNGRKSASLKKCSILTRNYNTGWVSYRPA